MVAPPTPAPERPVVRARGIGFAYGRGARAVPALDGLGFELRAGRCLGLLGPNGSGKSTAIRLVLGMLAPGRGDLEVFGGPPGRREARARTGYVPEEGRRFGSLTGRETVDLFARLQGVRPRATRRRRVDDALARVGLSTAAWGRRVSNYSRGMARRLALAAAWVHRPPLLVLDEPTSGLDPLGTEEVLAILAEHRREGGAILLSTHDRPTAEGACDDALVLVEGRVALRGPPDSLLVGDASPSLLGLMRRAARA